MSARAARLAQHAGVAGTRSQRRAPASADRDGLAPRRSLPVKTVKAGAEMDLGLFDDDGVADGLASAQHGRALPLASVNVVGGLRASEFQCSSQARCKVEKKL